MDVEILKVPSYALFGDALLHPKGDARLFSEETSAVLLRSRQTARRHRQPMGTVAVCSRMYAALRVAASLLEKSKEAQRLASDLQGAMKTEEARAILESMVARATQRTREIEKLVSALRNEALRLGKEGRGHRSE